MDPFTIALATFGVQKLRGKSTRTALKDAALVGGATYGIGQLAQAGAFGTQAQAGQVFLVSIGRGSPFSTIRNLGEGSLKSKIIGQKGDKELYKALTEKAVESGVETDAGKALLRDAAKVKPGGIAGMSTTGKVFTAAALTPLLMGEEDPV